MNGIKGKVLIDSNIFIYYFNGEKQVKIIMDKIRNQEVIGYFSVISYIELLCYPGLTKSEESKIKHFLRGLVQVKLEDNIVETTIKIRKLYKVRLPDAIIAATAIVKNLQLITRNSKDFENIKDIDLMNPFFD